MTGRYQTYPEYRDSGVEWLGEVPTSWQTKKLKYLCSIQTGDKDTVNAVEGGNYPFFVRSQTIESINSYSADCEAVLTAGDGVGVGRVFHYFEGKFDYHQRVYMLNRFRLTLGKFIFYYLKSNFHKVALEGAAKSTVDSLRLPLFQNFEFSVPSPSEQHQIARFLDHETARIDQLISKQERLIELLKEKRQAVISHAVTKGLDPDAPMKDSGVEWLGEVPESWIVRRLKHTATLQSGIPKGKDLTGKTSIEIPMLRVANVQDGYLSLDDVHAIKIEPHEFERYKLQSGDVLMNEGGDNDKLGRGAVWRDEVVPCIHQNHVFAIRTKDIEPEWLDTLTRASYAKFHFYRVAKQSTNLASISSTNIKETPLLIPPNPERADILLFLNNQFKRFDSLETKAISAVSLLKERRTALISAAVTGKIDVRNWEPPTTNDKDAA